MFGKKANLIGLAISAICLFLVFRKVDFAALVAAVASLSYGYLAAALAIFLLTFGVRALRWKLLLDPAKPIPYRRLLSVIFIGYMANNVLPARLGEIVRAVVIGRKENVRKSTTIATIFIERIFDGLSLLFILGLFLGLYDARVLPLGRPLPNWVTHAGLLASAVFLGAFGFVAALEFFPTFPGLLTRLFHRFAPAHMAGKLEAVLEAFVNGVACLRSFKALLAVFGLSLVVWCMEGCTYFMVGEAFHMALPIHAFLVTMVMVNLATIAPSAPGFVGTFQAVSVLALGSLFGVAKASALAYGLVLNVGEYLPVTLLGIGFLAAENLSFNTVLHPDAEPTGADDTPEPRETAAAAKTIP